MGLLPVDDALRRVLASARPLAIESVRIEEALGRALATDIAATRTLPPWDTSAMDGFAVRAADVASPPSRLKVVGTLFAGQRPTRRVDGGEAVRIMTGAPLPDGADAVVMQEHTTRDDDEVVVLEAVPPGANVRRAGEDIHAGSRLLAEGTPLGLAEAGALWAQGLAEVPVRRRPTVAIASSGDELCPVGEAPNGRIVDTNSPVIAAAVRRAGGVPSLLGIAPDRLEALVELIGRGLGADVLITVSGASVGEKDFTRDALAQLGVEADFWKVAMKPGKPLAFGRRGGTLVFGLPGNPVSALVTFELFVRPALRALQGLPPGPAIVPGRAAVALPRGAAPSLTHFVRVVAEARDGALWVRPRATQSSGALSSLVAATHLARIPPEVPGIEAGAPVDLVPVSWGP